MSGEKRPPEERWRRVGASRSLVGRRSEEMTHSNTFPPRGSEVPFEYPKGMTAIEIPRMKKFMDEGRT